MSTQDQATIIAQNVYDWNADQYERASRVPADRDKTGAAARSAERYLQTMTQIKRDNPQVKSRARR